MIEGQYVKLRALEIEDLPKLRDWRNSKSVRMATREYRLLNMINQKNWFEKTHNENPPSSLMFGVITNKKKLIGVCGLTYIDWKNKHAEISLYLNLENWQNTKEAKDAMITLIEYGFKEVNLHRLWVEVFSIAKKNLALVKKFGFIKEGTFREKLWRDGKWWNSEIYSILSSEYGIK